MKALVNFMFSAIGAVALLAMCLLALHYGKGCIDRSNSEHVRSVRKKESAEWTRECVKHRESYDRHEDCRADAAKLFPGAK